MDELPAKPAADDQAAQNSSAQAEKEYDSWARAKIEAALMEANAHPDRGMLLGDVWKRFGLEH